MIKTFIFLKGLEIKGNDRWSYGQVFQGYVQGIYGIFDKFLKLFQVMVFNNIVFRKVLFYQYFSELNYEYSLEYVFGGNQGGLDGYQDYIINFFFFRMFNFVLFIFFFIVLKLNVVVISLFFRFLIRLRNSFDFRVNLKRVL